MKVLLTGDEKLTQLQWQQTGSVTFLEDLPSPLVDNSAAYKHHVYILVLRNSIHPEHTYKQEDKKYDDWVLLGSVSTYSAIIKTANQMVSEPSRGSQRQGHPLGDLPSKYPSLRRCHPSRALYHVRFPWGSSVQSSVLRTSFCLVAISSTVVNSNRARLSWTWVGRVLAKKGQGHIYSHATTIPTDFIDQSKKLGSYLRQTFESCCGKSKFNKNRPHCVFPLYQRLYWNVCLLSYLRELSSY